MQYGAAEGSYQLRAFFNTKKKNKIMKMERLRTSRPNRQFRSLICDRLIAPSKQNSPQGSSSFMSQCLFFF